MKTEPHRGKHLPQITESVSGGFGRETHTRLNSVVLKPECMLKSPGKLINLQITGLYLQNS